MVPIPESRNGKPWDWFLLADVQEAMRILNLKPRYDPPAKLDYAAVRLILNYREATKKLDQLPTRSLD